VREADDRRPDRAVVTDEAGRPLAEVFPDPALAACVAAAFWDNSRMLFVDARERVEDILRFL